MRSESELKLFCFKSFGINASFESEFFFAVGVLHGDVVFSYAVYLKARIAQGRENTRKFLKENPAIAAEIDALVRAEMMGKNAAEAPMIEEEEDDFDDLPLLGADDE